MIIKRQAKISSRNLFLEVFRACCFVVVATLLFSFQTPKWSASPVQEKVERQAAAAHEELKSSSHGDHLPSAPTPTPVEPPLPDEGESENDGDDELGKIYGLHPIGSKQILDANECQFTQLNFAIDNLSSVSLFILYHCWKDFLLH